MQYYSYEQYRHDLNDLVSLIDRSQKTYKAIFPVVQGGTVLASDICHMTGIPMIDPHEDCEGLNWSAILMVDDLVDSGRTACALPQQSHLACLIQKEGASYNPKYCVYRDSPKEWITFWWEGTKEKSIEDSVVRQLQFIGEDATREGLEETPNRVVRSWDTLYGGYKQKEEDFIKIFYSDNYNQIVLVKDIEFYSTCEHHMLPFFGKAHIAYIPYNGNVIGVSKLVRILEMYARRLQIQERLGEQVTTCLEKHLEPHGSACIIEAQHFCMTSRGVQKQHSIMTTSSLKGAFMEKPAARQELMELIRR